MNVSNTSLMHAKVSYGVPQGLVPGPILFTQSILYPVETFCEKQGRGESSLVLL